MPALNAPDRWQLVGLTARAAGAIPRGAKIVADPDHALPESDARATSRRGASVRTSTRRSRWRWCPRGRARHGETLWAVSPLADARVEVVARAAGVRRPRRSAASWLTSRRRRLACPLASRSATCISRARGTSAAIRAHAAFVAEAQALFGLPLPITPMTSARSAERVVLWLGPRAWLFVERIDGAARRLRSDTQGARRHRRRVVRRVGELRRVDGRRRRGGQRAESKLSAGFSSARVSRRSLCAERARSHERARLPAGRAPTGSSCWWRAALRRTRGRIFAPRPLPTATASCRRSRSPPGSASVRDTSPQRHPNGRVIAGSFSSAVCAVHAGRPQPRRQHAAQQQEIHPEALVAAKGRVFTQYV